MYKKIIPIILATMVLLSACGPQGTPTLSPVDVEGTAVAAAWTIVAATQQAIPTATPLPPTETPSPTPLPTNTLEPLPTLDPISIPTQTQASANLGECEGPLNLGEAGPRSDIRVENESGGTITAWSLHLQQGTNLFGQCGYMGLTPLNKGEKRRVSIPKGTFLLSFFGPGNGYCFVENRVGDNHLFVVKIRKDSCVVK